MPGQIGVFRYDAQGLVAHVLGMRCREADAHVGRGLGHHAEQVGECGDRAVRSLESV